jgi:hypothetical protein
VSPLTKKLKPFELMAHGFQDTIQNISVGKVVAVKIDLPPNRMNAATMRRSTSKKKLP